MTITIKNRVYRLIDFGEVHNRHALRLPVLWFGRIPIVEVTS